jgi:hypothetical protein
VKKAQQTTGNDSHSKPKGNKMELNISVIFGLIKQQRCSFLFQDGWVKSMTEKELKEQEMRKKIQNGKQRLRS